MSETFGQVIRKARREEEYSQRELAKLIGVDYTYLSKLENDHAGYPPSQQVIESLATHLKLNAQTLGELAGRLSSDDQKVFKELVQKYQQMPILLRRMKDNPNFAKKIISEATKLETEE
ncbi:helix-turn-helix transcriptional regulator [Microcystis aeruginosa CS-564/01]|uniref:helix-turn-helix domain-containing protein n=1 Tax=Microcystis aeruginosa TaxID=1126 RepID=UPI00232EDCB5|nr:helix-turn-helix transcriptional regulator [Microcystis aeruginosa]MDB9424391.1 helix-turn-helix transcriptional regulator [Microcystis aeruginosa CS-564/01]